VATKYKRSIMHLNNQKSIPLNFVHQLAYFLDGTFTLT